MTKSQTVRRVNDIPTRIAVTGAAGFLGRHTVEWLAGLPTTERVLALDLQTPAQPDDPSGVVAPVTRDIRQPLDDLLVNNGIQAVFHLAYVVRPVRARAWARAINVGATESLLGAARSAGVSRFVYPSSTTVYGARPGNTRPFTEEDPPNPVPGFQYSEDKVAVEKLLSRWQAETPGATVTVFRGCVVMGPTADNFILRALKMKWLPVPAFSDPEMQFLHVSDLVHAFERALESRTGGTYNVAGDGTVRWRRMVQIFGNHALPVPGPLLERLTGLTWTLRLQSRSPACGVNFVRYPWLASTEKIQTELGWSAKHTSEEALISTRDREPSG